eukprot:gene18360-24056_t
MTEGKIVSWAKKVGDKVSSGDVLLVVESDKADMDVESYEDGYLAAILIKEGESTAVGAPVALIVKSLDDVKKIKEGGDSSTAAVAPVAAAPVTSVKVETKAAATTTLPNVNFDKIFMPALSSTMTEGKIVSWTKKEGEKISSGDVVLVVESDKADMDVESYEDGYLASILVKEGESATVGAPVALIVKSIDDIKTVKEYSGSLAVGSASAPTATTDVITTSAPASTSASSPPVVNTGRVAASGYAQAVAKEQGVDLKTVTPSRPDGYITSKDLVTGTAGTVVHIPAQGVINATPTARKAASENNVDLSKIKGSGNFGRVTLDDVLITAGKLQPKKVSAPAPVATTSSSAPAPAAAPAKAETKVVKEVLDGVVPMDGMQKAVAKNMEKTLNVPIFRVSREIVTDSFDQLYAKLKPKGVTVSALLAKAVAEVLKSHPIINAAYVEGGIKFNKDINVAMAVAIDGGLITPTLIKASEQDIFSISRSWKDLVDRAKSKKLTPAEYSSGTFTISNLGMFGVHQFDAILPPNTGSILAIAASTPKVVQLKNGHFGVQKSMIVTITCDHRHIYGADAADFLKELADLLENNVDFLLLG